jgi:hypothetical protein
MKMREEWKEDVIGNEIERDGVSASCLNVK